MDHWMDAAINCNNYRYPSHQIITSIHLCRLRLYRPGSHGSIWLFKCWTSLLADTLSKQLSHHIASPKRVTKSTSNFKSIIAQSVHAVLMATVIHHHDHVSWLYRRRRRSYKIQTDLNETCFCITWPSIVWLGSGNPSHHQIGTCEKYFQTTRPHVIAITAVSDTPAKHMTAG